jgi:DNA-binding transcriptional LysR family regulator
MTRPEWDDVRVFLAVARAGSLTGAARALGLGVATVSRRIERFERALGAPLFARHQSGYGLTDDGAALVERAEALETAAAALAPVAAVAAGLAGTVRLATAETFANELVIPSLPALIDQNPGLSVEIVTDVRTINLHRRDADLALRLVAPSHGRVTLRRLGTLGFGLYASPMYLAARAAPADAGVIDRDRVIAWDEGMRDLPSAEWLGRVMPDRAPVVSTTTLAGQLAAARAGLGLAVLPHFLAESAGLVMVDADLDLEQPIWLVVHADLAASVRVRAVAEHLARLVAAEARRLRFGAKAAVAEP